VEYEGNPDPWDTPTTTVSTPPINGDSEEDPKRALEDDLNTIALFFAGGEDDQSEAEEVIWARLTAKVCQCDIFLPIFDMRLLVEVVQHMPILGSLLSDTL